MKKICVLMLAIITISSASQAKAQASLFIQVAYSSTANCGAGNGCTLATAPEKNAVSGLPDFAGTWSRSGVILSWTSQQESTADKFIIEKSIDGSSWQTLTTVASTDNNNSPEVYYNTDTKPAAINYYRLKQIDADGAFAYSPILKVLAKKRK